MNQIIHAADKAYEVNVCSTSYFFSKEQIILFSPTAFLKILESNQVFNVLCPLDISEEFLVPCFQEIFSLLSTSEAIKISQNNVLGFQYLSIIFENSALFSTCENVLSSDNPQTFFFISQHFASIPQNLFDSLNDFRITLNNYEIRCNRIFASLISNKILNQIKEHTKLDFIDFSNYRFPKTLKCFLTFSKEIESKLMKVIAGKFMMQFTSLNLAQSQFKASFKPHLCLLFPMIFLKFHLLLLTQLTIFFLLIFFI
jgi:hypothetical protein